MNQSFWKKTPIRSSCIFLIILRLFLLRVKLLSFTPHRMEGMLKLDAIFFLRNCSSRKECFRYIIQLQVQKLFLGNIAIIISERQVSGNFYFPFTDGQMEAFFLIYQLQNATLSQSTVLGFSQDTNMYMTRFLF